MGRQIDKVEGWMDRKFDKDSYIDRQMGRG